MYASSHDAARSRWDTEVKQGLQTPTLYPNQRDQLGRRQVTADLDIAAISTEIAAYGSSDGVTYRKHAALRVTLRDQIARGDKGLLERAGLIRTKFRHLTIDGNVYGAPRVSAVGRDVGVFDQFWRVDMECPFYHDDSSLQTDAQSVSATAVDQQAAHDTARDRFRSEITTKLGVTTQFDNDEPQPPPRGGLWVHHSVTTTDPVEITPGKRAVVAGFAFAMIFEPLHQGTDDTLALADSIVLRFRSVTVASVAFGKQLPPEVRTIGRPAAAAPQFFQTNVVMPFLYQEVA